MKASVWAFVALLLGSIAPMRADDNPHPEQTITRVTATLNGVFSPRGFFNIMVGLYQLDGVSAAKLDLKKSQMTMDFRPGVTVTSEEIQRVEIDGGYKPGPVKIESLTPNEALETAPGWTKIKHPKSKNPLLRWFQLNF